MTENPLSLVPAATNEAFTQGLEQRIIKVSTQTTGMQDDLVLVTAEFHGGTLYQRNQIGQQRHAFVFLVFATVGRFCPVGERKRGIKSNADECLKKVCDIFLPQGL